MHKRYHPMDAYMRTFCGLTDNRAASSGFRDRQALTDNRTLFCAMRFLTPFRGSTALGSQCRRNGRFSAEEEDPPSSTRALLRRLRLTWTRSPPVQAGVDERQADPPATVDSRLASMRSGTQPAAIGLPLSGATTNQLASTGPRTPKPPPRSSSGQGGSRPPCPNPWGGDP